MPGEQLGFNTTYVRISPQLVSPVFQRDDKEIRRQVRAYLIPDSRVWQEIINRYYYQEDSGDGQIEIPSVLKSKEFVVFAEPSHPSHLSQSSECKDKTEKTDKSLSSARGDEKTAKPSRNCPVCGSNSWWRTRNGEWVCVECHPDPLSRLFTKEVIEQISAKYPGWLPPSQQAEEDFV